MKKNKNKKSIHIKKKWKVLEWMHTLSTWIIRWGFLEIILFHQTKNRTFPYVNEEGPRRERMFMVGETADNN